MAVKGLSGPCGAQRVFLLPVRFWKDWKEKEREFTSTRKNENSIAKVDSRERRV